LGSLLSSWRQWNAPSRQKWAFACWASLGLPQGNGNTWAFIARATLRFRAALLPQSQTRWSISLFRPPHNPALLKVMARSFLCCRPDRDEIARHAAIALGHPWPWLRPIAGRFVESFGQHVRPRHRDLVEFLRRDLAFKRASDQHGEKITVQSWVTGPEPMLPVPAASDWNIPQIESKSELATWFNLTASEIWAEINAERKYAEENADEDPD
jgi:hypothetical protein